MKKNISLPTKAFVAAFTLSLQLLFVPLANAGLVFVTEENAINSENFIIDFDDSSTDFIDLDFGTVLGAQFRFDIINDYFQLNRDINLLGNEALNFRVENLAAAPTCDGTLAGRLYHNTTDNVTYVCDGTTWLDINAGTTYTGSGGITLTGTNFTADLGTSIDASEIDANAVQDSEIDYTAVTLADFTNDAGFITTDTDTTYTGSGGITLTGTNFTNDLGTSIDSSEIVDDSITSADILAGTIAQSDLNLTDITLADFTNDAGFVTTDNDTTYTGSGGITLTGTNFTNDLGTSIDSSEIENGTIVGLDLDFTDITLADFTNDAGFVTTDNDTTYTGSGGITLTGTNFTADLGTSIDASEIDTNAVNDDEINYANVTLNDFTNDAGFITTDTDTTYTGSGGITLTGTNFTNDLGTSIDSSEIENGTIVGLDLNFTDITLADFTNDAGFVTTDNDTTYTGSGGITLTGTNFTNDLGTSIDSSEIENGTIVGLDLNFTDITLADFTNDAGFITTDTDTTYTGSGGITLTGTNFTNDLGTSIDSSEIVNDTITADDINVNAVTASELADDAVDTNAILNNAVDGTKINLTGNTQGDLMQYNGTDWARLALGTNAQYLGVNDAGTDLVWENVDTLADADGTTQIQVEEGVNDDTIRFDTAGGERMIIDNTGNVLIGAAAETIENVAFSPDGNDVFLADSLGVEGQIYTDATATKYEFVELHGCVRGSATAGTVAGGNSPVVRFDSGNNSQMRCSVPIPDDWVAGTDINLETFWSPSDNGTGDVDFDLEYASFAVGETIAGGSFVDTIPGATYETVAATTQLEVYQMTHDFAAADLGVNEMLNFNLHRTPGDAGDTYGADINIHMLRIAYTGKKLQ